MPSVCNATVFFFETSFMGVRPLSLKSTTWGAFRRRGMIQAFKGSVNEVNAALPG
jgi:hypothetical protein